MNQLFDLPVPDPLEILEQAAFLPPCPAGPDGLLDSIEASIEPPPVPVLDAYAESDRLDLAEVSEESQQLNSKFFLPDVMLDRLEESIEGRTIPPTFESEDPVLFEDSGWGHAWPEHRSEDAPSLPYYTEVPVPQLPWLRGPRPPLIRRGRCGTGVRNMSTGSAGGSDGRFCPVEQAWVEPEICQECEYYAGDSDDEGVCEYVGKEHEPE